MIWKMGFTFIYLQTLLNQDILVFSTSFHLLIYFTISTLATLSPKKQVLVRRYYWCNSKQEGIMTSFTVWWSDGLNFVNKCGRKSFKRKREGKKEELKETSR